jgi:hypothetical protein
MQELKWFEETDRAAADIVSRIQGAAGAKPGWTVVDASGLTDEEFDEAVRTVRAKGVAQPHATWFVRPDNKRQRILLYLHHVVADGWSIPVLLGEVLGIVEASGQDSRQ